MKKVLALMSPLMFCLALQAEVIPPSGLLQVGDSSTPFTLYGVPGSKLSLLNIDVRGDDWAVSGHATVNPDPFIDYGFTIKNLGSSDLNFMFLLATPYTGGPYSYLTSSHSGSATDSYGITTPINGTVNVTPQAGGVHQPSVDGNPYGAIMGGCSANPTPGSSIYCGIGNVNGLAITSQVNGTLSILLGGTLSAGDIYTFNGLASISNIPGDEVPEPATMGLGIAALALGAFFRRRIKA